MTNDAIIQTVRDQLFADNKLDVYAIYDGASVAGLLNQLDRHDGEYCCLFSGDLAPDHAAAAPYLVQLRPDDKLTQWTLENGWGHHWGVFVGVQSGLSFRKLRKHFRTFLMVRSHAGQPLYFRYYDPRVLRVYLPTCNKEEMAHVFGPLAFYAMEGDGGQMLLRMTPDESKPRVEEIRFAESVT